jgi:hypothetical protein
MFVATLTLFNLKLGLGNKLSRVFFFINFVRFFCQFLFHTFFTSQSGYYMQHKRQQVEGVCVFLAVKHHPFAAALGEVHRDLNSGGAHVNDV